MLCRVRQCRTVYSGKQNSRSARAARRESGYNLRARVEVLSPLLPSPSVVEEDCCAGAAKRSDYRTLGDHFHRARKAPDGLRARERGDCWAARMPVLPWSRKQNSAGDFGVWAKWRRGEFVGLEHSRRAESLSGAGD